MLDAACHTYFPKILQWRHLWTIIVTTCKYSKKCGPKCGINNEIPSTQYIFVLFLYDEITELLRQHFSNMAEQYMATSIYIVAAHQVRRRYAIDIQFLYFYVIFIHSSRQRNCIFLGIAIFGMPNQIYQNIIFFSSWQPKNSQQMGFIFKSILLQAMWRSWWFMSYELLRAKRLLLSPATKTG